MSMMQIQNVRRCELVKVAQVFEEEEVHYNTSDFGKLGFPASAWIPPMRDF